MLNFIFIRAQIFQNLQLDRSTHHSASQNMINCLLNIFIRAQIFSNFQLDRSTHHSASQDVLEVKTMLLRLTRILQQVEKDEDGCCEDKDKEDV